MAISFNPTKHTKLSLNLFLIADENFEYERWVDRRICERHVKIYRLVDAKEARRVIQSKIGNKFSIGIYLCGFCGEYHIGTKKKGVKHNWLEIYK